jgi:hypothetical protein
MPAISHKKSKSLFAISNSFLSRRAASTEHKVDLFSELVRDRNQTNQHKFVVCVVTRITLLLRGGRDRLPAAWSIRKNKSGQGEAVICYVRRNCSRHRHTAQLAHSCLVEKKPTGRISIFACCRELLVSSSVVGENDRIL